MEELPSCNFVSITQAFDTSTSMGRLTLNMLLSFAQFEREVSSERVRDRLRSQKAKGLWTEGNVPLGYDVADKKLVVNEAEAKQIQYIYETYLKVSSLLVLKDEVYNYGIRVKQKKSNVDAGKEATGLVASVLNRILRDPVYIGKVRFKKGNIIYDGVHEPIIDKKLYDAVQEKLTAQNNRGDVPYRQGTYLLHNKITDAMGNIFTNRKSSKNQVRKYRYYNLKSLYLPAGDIEKITKDVVQSFLNSDMKALPEATRLAFKEVQYDEAIIRPLIYRIIYQENRLTYFLNVSNISYLETFKQGILNTRAEVLPRSYLSNDGKFIVIEKSIFISKGIATNRYSGGETSILTKTENAHTLIRALIRLVL